MDQPAKPRGRPPTPAGTPPARAIRIPDELWEQARATAAARHESLPEVIRRALTAYVRRHRRDVTPGAPQGRDDAG